MYWHLSQTLKNLFYIIFSHPVIQSVTYTEYHPRTEQYMKQWEEEVHRNIIWESDFQTTCSWAKSISLPVFINKILLQNMQAHSFMCPLCHFNTMTELSNCDKDHISHKNENIYLFFTEKVHWLLIENIFQCSKNCKCLVDISCVWDDQIRENILYIYFS